MSEDFEEWKRLTTAAVSDALDRMGAKGQCNGISPLERSFRVVGRAFTVKYANSAGKGTVGDYLDDIEPGTVLVLDNGGRLDATVWGELTTLAARECGAAGTVIDGVCRDSLRSIDLRYPVFSRGTYMRTGKDRVRVEAYQIPISVGNVKVAPGDLVIGDADGVVIIQKHVEKKVLTAALEIRRAEDQIRRALLSGTPLSEARRKFRYFELQRSRRSSLVRLARPTSEKG